MADMYNPACTSSSSSPPEPDDFSLFLHQILLRSSQSSSSATTHRGIAPPLQLQPNPPSYSLAQIPNRSIPSSLVPGSETQIAGSSSRFGNVFSAPGGYFQPNAAHLSSSSAGGTNSYDPEEYDCDDSEEGFDALAEETPARPVPPRGSSKRTRAAEVHNQSEKRRRSRINEKMKALQNLIPNSNKTDKASMLDEAIEYLKQLQLQVQMLTMKNGLSLYPMFHPGVLQSGQLARMKMDLFEGNGLLGVGATSALTLNKNIPENSLFNISNHCTKQAQPSGVTLPSIIDPDIIFNQLLPVPSEEPRKVDAVAPQKLHENRSEAKPLGSGPCNVQSFDAKGNAVDTAGIERPESLILSHLECDPIFASHLNDLCAERRPPESGMESRRLNF